MPSYQQYSLNKTQHKFATFFAYVGLLSSFDRPVKTVELCRIVSNLKKAIYRYIDSNLFQFEVL